MPHLIVVGSGVAGLTSALTAHAGGCRVTVVTKSALSESNSFYAQGGVAAAIWDDDSVASHISDTVRAGAGLCDPDAVRTLCIEGPARIHELIGRGIPFDRTPEGLARGLEAAHSNARILHAGGDATGAAMETALVRAVRDSDVEIRERTLVTDLVVRDGRVCGVWVIDGNGEPGVIDGDAVLIASGGAGRLFQHTTNPEIATGDGVAAAWRAGAQLADVEFYQFHPTALSMSGTDGRISSFLVSEAVRGEGAVLISPTGRRFMPDLHPDAELAPRDVVARGIAVEMAAQDGSPVMLDATKLGRRFLETRFPTIDAACRRAGLDWSSEPIPVTPAAHYWMGGIATDTRGRTTLPGLYAAGEAACTGAHGANRLASNSLLEALVFAHRAAVDAAARPTGPWQGSVLGDVAGDEIGEHPAAPGDYAAATGRPVARLDRSRLQALMWASVGLHRNAAGLESAIDRLAGWETDRDSAAGRRSVEDANLLDLARVTARAALARTESRGAHYRTDYPTPSSNGARHRAWAGKVPVPC